MVSGEQLRVRFVLTPAALGVRLRLDDWAEGRLWPSFSPPFEHSEDEQMARIHDLSRTSTLDRLSTPSEMTNDAMTKSPTVTVLTPSPTASTTP